MPLSNYNDNLFQFFDLNTYVRQLINCFIGCPVQKNRKFSMLQSYIWKMFDFSEFMQWVSSRNSNRREFISLFSVQLPVPLEIYVPSATTNSKCDNTDSSDNDGGDDNQSTTSVISNISAATNATSSIFSDHSVLSNMHSASPKIATPDPILLAYIDGQVNAYRIWNILNTHLVEVLSLKLGTGLLSDGIHSDSDNVCDHKCNHVTTCIIDSEPLFKMYKSVFDKIKNIHTTHHVDIWNTNTSNSGEMHDLMCDCDNLIVNATNCACDIPSNQLIVGMAGMCKYLNPGGICMYLLPQNIDQPYLFSVVCFLRTIFSDVSIIAPAIPFTCTWTVVLCTNFLKTSHTHEMFCAFADQLSVFSKYTPHYYGAEAGTSTLTANDAKNVQQQYWFDFSNSYGDNLIRLIICFCEKIASDCTNTLSVTPFKTHEYFVNNAIIQIHQLQISKGNKFVLACCKTK